MWHQKYSLPCNNVLAFLACKVTSKVLGIGASENSWGDLKTIKLGKISTISSDVSKKQCIVYTYTFIKSNRTEQYHSEKILIIIILVIFIMNMMMILINS